MLSCTPKPPTSARAKRVPRPSQAALFVDDNEDPVVLMARELQGLVAGLDEAGRGPLAGPVVAGCVVLPHPLPAPLLTLNDSKALSKDARELLFPLIQEHALAWGVGVIEPERIDEINILRASLEAMAVALQQCELMLQQPLKGALLDGNQKAPLPLHITQRTLVGGDAKSRPIMAAAVLAKVVRDRRMLLEHARFPRYGFNTHMGYGTPQHLAALKLYGASVVHRRSFAPVSAALQAGPRDG